MTDHIIKKENLPKDFLKFLEQGGEYPTDEFLTKEGRRIYLVDWLYSFKQLAEGEIYKDEEEQFIEIASTDDELILMSLKGRDKGKIFLSYNNKISDRTLIANSFRDFLEMVKNSVKIPKVITEIFTPKVLTEIFVELEVKGIVARANFSCCLNCGSGEIWEEMIEHESKGNIVRGYVFYHNQDAESMMEGNMLYLAYGATSNIDITENSEPIKPGTEEDGVRIGQEVVEVIKKYNLDVEWSGEFNQRIGVKNVPLKR
ncbi:MAG: DUF6891 domain-containing protein [Candidatus Odinarchaeota archaeon]